MYQERAKKIKLDGLDMHAMPLEEAIVRLGEEVLPQGFLRSGASVATNELDTHALKMVLAVARRAI